MSNFVFVLDTHKRPLDPVHPGEARHLLDTGKAAVFRRYPFTIILKEACPDVRMHDTSRIRTIRISNSVVELIDQQRTELHLVE